MSSLVALLLSIFFISPSSTAPNPIDRCNHLTIREAAHEDLLLACIGKDVQVEDQGLAVFQKRLNDAQFSGGFSTFKGKLVLSEPLTKNFDINQMETNLVKPDLVLYVHNSFVLSHLDINEMSNDFSDPKYGAFIRGNRYLSRQSIEKVKRVFGVTDKKKKFEHIQDPGECYFGDAFHETGLYNFVSSFDVLKGCVYFLGDLTVSYVHPNLANFPKSLVEVRGCITIDDNQISDVSFLDNIVVPEGACGNKSKHIITGNPYVSEVPKSIAMDKKWSVVLKTSERSHCLDPHYRQSPFGRFCSDEYKYNRNLEEVCHWKPMFGDFSTWVFKKKSEIKIDCRKIRGNVTFHVTYPDEKTDALSTVELIEGVLEILNTTMTDIRLFPNLHTVIGVNPTLPVINITGNQFLKILEFPSLNFVFSKAPSNVKLIVIKDNGEYGMPRNEYDRLVYLFGEERLDIDVENVVGPIPMEKIFLIAAFAVAFLGATVMWKMEVDDKYLFIRNSTAKSFDANEMFTMIGPMLPWTVKVRFWLRQRFGLAD